MRSTFLSWVQNLKCSLFLQDRMSNYMGIIFTVVGLFSTTVLFSICMSCYKCFMKRRRKALSSRTVSEQERALAAGNVEAPLPNGATKYLSAASTSNSYRNQLLKNKAVTGHGKNPAKSVINGRKYPQITSSVVHGRDRSPVPGHLEIDSLSEQALKRHSLYYSVESMASLASAIEDNPWVQW